MHSLKKTVSTMLALAMVFTVATCSLSAFATSGFGKTDSLGLFSTAKSFITSIFNKDEDKTPSIPSASSVIKNVYQSLADSGITYDKDVDVQVKDQTATGARICIIDPLTGKTLFDKYVNYDSIDGYIWGFEISKPTLPSTIPSAKDVINNVYKSLYNSGIYLDKDADITVTDRTEKGARIHIVDPLTGKTLFDKSVNYEDVQKYNWDFKVSTPDCDILRPHFDDVTTTVPDTTKPDTEIEVEDETPLADVTPEIILPDAAIDYVDSTPATSIANTGDTAAISAITVVSALAGVVFVTAKKMH